MSKYFLLTIGTFLMIGSSLQAIDNVFEAKETDKHLIFTFTKKHPDGTIGSLQKQFPYGTIFTTDDSFDLCFKEFDYKKEEKIITYIGGGKKYVYKFLLKVDDRKKVCLHRLFFKLSHHEFF